MNELKFPPEVNMFFLRKSDLYLFLRLKIKIRRSYKKEKCVQNQNLASQLMFFCITFKA